MVFLEIHMAYTYLLTHIPTGKRYYGVKYGKNSHPENLWITYFSSSKIVKDLIKSYGKDSFIAEVRKLFDTPEEAFAWEQKLIKKCNLIHNTNWLNEGCFGTGNLTYAMKYKTKEHIEKVTKSRLSKNYKHSLETREKIKEANLRRTEDWKNKISDSLTGKKQSDETIQKRSEKIKEFWSNPKNKEMMRKKQKDAWKSGQRKTKHVSEETKRKISETLKKKTQR